MTGQDIQQQIERLGPWFYEFDLGSGRRTTSVLPEEVIPIFSTRLEMVNRVARARFGSRMREIDCIDVGCHEGFYSAAMARQGARRVLGIDVRETNIEKARFVADALGLRNVEYRIGNCEDLSAGSVGQYDLSLFLGILYHLENPMLCLRNMAAVTRELCIVETQVIDEVRGSTEWGARSWTREYRGVMALIDESGEYYAQNAETGASPIAMCPSPQALEFMLRQAGFRKTEIVEPPPDAYEQQRRRKRLVCAAYK